MNFQDVTQCQIPEAMREDDCIKRIRLFLTGMLQGMGFRPFVYRLAKEHDLAGWVRNTSQGVLIEVEGSENRLQQFLFALQKAPPSKSSIQEIDRADCDLLSDPTFEILESESEGCLSALILPDLATCEECLGEIFDSSNRRYHYPFISCVHCGPRFSIIESAPYDRHLTSMKKFPLCVACKEEFDTPDNRRFHAQSNACHDCGPQLELWDRQGKCVVPSGREIEATAHWINKGAIVAVKGVGGFHLLVDARNRHALINLRTRKSREEKPFAVMFPSLDVLRRNCETSLMEEQLLLSPAAPIVLVRKRRDGIAKGGGLCDQVAPSNPYVGAMLSSNPVQHLLMKELGYPVVATSGNVSEETLCKDNEEALTRLGRIADFFLVHDRPIIHHSDDSIVQVVADKERILRRSRGYVPSPIELQEEGTVALAVGGHLKNTVAFSRGRQVLLSQHLGTLDNTQTLATFRQTLREYSEMYPSPPEFIVCDAHPEYPSHQFAQASYPECEPVQHHLAHVFSCMAENKLKAPVLGVAWDGSGYGMDGTLWGGEFFCVRENSIRRVASFKPFPLPGGVQAIQQPRRSALGLLYALQGESCFESTWVADHFSSEELRVLKSMLMSGINCPLTSSCGRLFDAVASLAKIRQQTTFEGQAAMELEFALPEKLNPVERYSVLLNRLASMEDNLEEDDGIDWNLQFQIDWSPMVLSLLGDIEESLSESKVALKFHNTLVEVTCQVAREINVSQVVLTGGCFQNKYLTEATIKQLRSSGFNPYWHQRVPTNDGGLALGQIALASWKKRKE